MFLGLDLILSNIDGEGHRPAGPIRADPMIWPTPVCPEPRAQSGGLRVAGGNVARLTGRWTQG